MDRSNHSAHGSSSSSSSSSRSSNGDIIDGNGGEALRSLVRRIKEHGVDHETLHGVMRSLVSLSTHWLGSYAVEACILGCTATPEHRGPVASAFAALRDDELARMVQDEYGSCVLRRFLQSAAAKNEEFLELEEQVHELARRIEQLPDTVLEQTHAKKTVKAIGRMYARRGD